MKIFYSLVFLIPLLMGTTAFPQSSTLDASFGVGGKVITPAGLSNSAAKAIAITPDGKILVGGNELDTFYLGLPLDYGNLLQYNSNGTLDSTFGINGKVSPFLIAQTTIYSIAIQNDGKIIVSGDGGNISRYNKNGSIDTTFGHLGYASTKFINSYIFIRKIIIKSDGRILVGGAASNGTFESDYLAFAQYLPDGMIDSTFGTNGVVEIGEPFNPLQENATDVNDMAITAAGKIVAAINVSSQQQVGTDFLLYQFLPNGVSDSTFGINGVLQTDVDSLSDDVAYGIVALPDSSFAVCGSSYQSVYDPVADTSYSASGIAIIKYHPDGSFDSTFGTNGKVFTLPLPNKSVYGNYILSSSDGSLFVSGSTGYGYPNFDFLVVKYHSDGSVDSSFGTNGITTTDYAGYNDVSYSSALQPDGKIILVGQESNSTIYNIALARYGNIILPLHLLSFTATKNKNSNLLQWQTAQEINISGFEVQRSADGRSYTAIRYVNAGNSLYHFTDNQLLDGNNYYRLKMIDKNSTFTYSPVRIINNNYSLRVKVYPNPAKKNLQVQISNEIATILQWQIISFDGKVLMTNQWQVQTGSSTESINIEALNKGSYYLLIKTNSNKQSIVKFEKL